MKVVHVLPDGTLQEEDRNLSGPYYNRNAHISATAQNIKKDVLKK
jgi:hypothetical protein